VLQSPAFMIIVIIFVSMENLMNTKVLETDAAHFEIKEGIIFANYRQGIVITLDMAKDMVNRRMEFAENKSYPAIVVDDGVKSITKEARDYLAKDGAVGLIAGALVLKSVYSAYLGNFFLRLTKPPFPTKMFLDVKSALEWIEKYKPKI
jgi:hypothetical protein